MGCIINSRLHTPLSLLISHRCQKEACTEIKERIWALCSKIKLPVVIFYITFRTAYWKMFPLLGFIATLASVSLSFTILLSFLCLLFHVFVCVITNSHPLCNVLEWSLLACKVSPLTTSTGTLTSPEKGRFKSTSRPRTQHNDPHFLHHKRILPICICNVTAVFNNSHCPFFKKQKSEPRHLLNAIPISDTHPGVWYLVHQSIQHQVVSVPVSGTVGRDRLICQPQVPQTINKWNYQVQ